ncbi:PREDICTED: chromosome transmission fidelity protein 8 homolog [Vollenhovia emeryi]|uniref:chromosome transmission fidelity protein 8 homolog n=1 Tax=Vollenhovia emeryi TaxID=411798 RepID=UPI0005F42A40|nr:PREDICTED: chromosome transmission fidelity protein 8 homolog [Vollenhovia emeryi]
MIVPIKRDGDVKTWAIIDLQGDLKFEKVDSNPDNQLLGDLHFTKAGVPILIIGIHVLHGKEITLDRPLIVLERRRDAGNEMIEEEATVKTEYLIKAIVKRKLVFKSRPKPIVTNVPKPC